MLKVLVEVLVLGFVVEHAVVVVQDARVAQVVRLPALEVAVQLVPEVAVQAVLADVVPHALVAAVQGVLESAPLPAAAARDVAEVAEAHALLGVEVAVRVDVKVHVLVAVVQDVLVGVALDVLVGVLAVVAVNVLLHAEDAVAVRLAVDAHVLLAV